MNKSIRTLLIVFVVLVAVYFLFFRSGERVSTDKIDAKLFVADSSKIDKIEIVKNSETVILEKSGNDWKLTSPVTYPADTVSVYPMIKDLKNFRIESVASENPDKFINYLDTVNNAKITVYQEGKLLGTFILGKSQGFSNSYLKKPDENIILLASDIVSGNFTKSSKDIRLKKIISIPSIGLNKIEFKSTDSNQVNFTALRDSLNVWRIDGDSVTSAAMTGFLNLFENLNAEDFIDSTVTEFPTPTYTLTFTSAQQTVMNLYKIPNSEPEAFMFQVVGNPQLFKFFTGMASQIMKKKTDFVPEPLKK
ncbi:MAG: DUF4340 domain-containing protein [Chlorobi bacterium]|nr:DUF4340 domain-containing protein [Chlorobiota bacterium]MCI0715647.1 DUF4340 domain-containing protein [Chlorobiota bacterium]